MLRVYADGGSRKNPGAAAIGVVVCSDDDRILEEHASYIGTASNNEAEYRAILKGLEMAAKRGASEILCTSDSELVVRQLTGAYRVRHPRLRPLYEAAKAGERMFRKVAYRQLPRLTGHLARADELVNLALDDAGF